MAQNTSDILAEISALLPQSDNFAQFMEEFLTYSAFVNDDDE
jgi:hypothetical protein